MLWVTSSLLMVVRSSWVADREGWTQMRQSGLRRISVIWRNQLVLHLLLSPSNSTAVGHDKKVLMHLGFLTCVPLAVRSSWSRCLHSAMTSLKNRLSQKRNGSWDRFARRRIHPLEPLLLQDARMHLEEPLKWDSLVAQLTQPVLKCSRRRMHSLNQCGHQGASWD